MPPAFICRALALIPRLLPQPLWPSQTSRHSLQQQQQQPCALGLASYSTGQMYCGTAVATQGSSLPSSCCREVLNKPNPLSLPIKTAPIQAWLLNSNSDAHWLLNGIRSVPLPVCNGTWFYHSAKFCWCQIFFWFTHLHAYVVLIHFFNGPSAVIFLLVRVLFNFFSPL